MYFIEKEGMEFSLKKCKVRHVKKVEYVAIYRLTENLFGKATSRFDKSNRRRRLSKPNVSRSAPEQKRVSLDTCNKLI